MGRPKQAVVVIHGIGEQRPMETLRSFVEAILPDTKENPQTRYRSKPDRMAESFELRCLQVPSHRASNRPITDFYEYYWAHHMLNSRYGSVLSWLKNLISRPLSEIPAGLRPVYLITYAGLIVGTAILAWGFLDQTGQSVIDRATPLYEKKQIYAAIGLLAAQAIGSHFILGYVADAARYLTPSPGNIEARNKIRSEGIKLLRSLHESGKYFRIVVVGHSLGSVIGYDVLRHLWVELRQSHDPQPTKQTLAREFDTVASHIQNLETPISPSEVEAFQQKQHGLWREHRKVGIPWLVTDFITLGSPLTHASLLMADSQEEFQKRKVEFEFPCCPPVPIQNIHYLKQYEPMGQQQHPVSIRIPHHGAVFASTRWTNIFFPYRMGIFGDLIGGPLSGSFGNGIKDVAVRPSIDGFINKTLYSHVGYWKTGEAKTDDRSGKQPEIDCLKALKSALRLNSLQSKDPWPKPTRLRVKCTK